MSFFIFFFIVITVYISANVYIFRKGLLAIASYPLLKLYITIFFWFLVSAYPAGRIIEKLYLSYFSDFLIWVGSFWLAALLYFFLFCLLIDLLRLANSFVPYLPSLVFGEKFRFYLFWFSLSVIGVLLFAGYLNSIKPVIKNVEIDIPKAAGRRDSLHAVLISDIHLGTIVGNGRLERIISEIDRIGPEIIMIAGDLVDEDLQPVLRQDIGHTLKKLDAPLGVYAVTGNHEYIGGADDAVEYLEKHGIVFIRDSVLKIDGSFYLIGREDTDMFRFTGRKRQPLEELATLTCEEYPVVLLDHQPVNLQKAARVGIDLQLSGHTHHGQLWPLNYITSAIYKVSRGYGKVANMQVYVTSGVGTWGPPVRTGSRPEIINMKILFDSEIEK